MKKTVCRKARGFLFCRPNEREKKMIIVMKPTATQGDVQTICDWISSLRYQPRVSQGSSQTVISCIGGEINPGALNALRSLPSVQELIQIGKKYKLVSRDFHAEDSIVEIGGVKIGGGHVPVIAGPCAIESYDQFRAAVEDLVKLGITVIRAMPFKPRTSTYDFQGLKLEGIRIMRDMKREFPAVSFVSEIPGSSQIELMSEVTDAFQVGTRNAQNYDLLERLAGAGKPVVLKRGMAGTVEEWLLAAEYLYAHGCKDVILCERGIRTFETATRNCLDLGGMAVAKTMTHLPIIVDPSHATGVRALVIPLSRAALAAGADGLIVEAHPDPAHAYSDAAQQIPSAEFGDYLAAIEPWMRLRKAAV